MEAMGAAGGWAAVRVAGIRMRKSRADTAGERPGQEVQTCRAGHSGYPAVGDGN